MIENLKNYLRALRLWWGTRPRWPGKPTVSIKMDAKVSRAMDGVWKATDKLFDAIFHQGVKK